MPPSISSPLRILLLSHPSAPQPSTLRDDEDYQISTRYYVASIPIWRDSLPTSPAEVQAWEDDWKKSEAAEVVEAIGAWIICFPTPSDHDELARLCTILRTVQRTIEHHTTSSYNAPDPLLVALLVPTSTVPSLDLGNEEWEDVCREEGGWEFIDGRVDISENSNREDTGKLNENGEKVGIARLKEALEANEWENGPTVSLDEDDAAGEDAFDLEGQGLEEPDMDLIALETGLMQASERKEGKLGDEDPGDEDVQALESMMMKMQAVRDLGVDLPEGERKRFAAKTVREVMKTL